MIINSNYCQLDKVAQLSGAIRGHTKDHKFIKILGIISKYWCHKIAINVAFLHEKNATSLCSHILSVKLQMMFGQ